MRTEMHLTIQDYFNRRLDSGFWSRARHSSKSDPLVGDRAFSHALAATHAFPDGDEQGMSIRDYMQKRIPSRRIAPAAKVAPDLNLQMRSASSAMETPSDRPAYPAAITEAEPPKIPPKSQSPSMPGNQRKILASIDKAAARFKLPPALIKAVVKTESDYQVRAVSPAGAQGLMQLMPATARELGVVDPFDIDQNILGGAQYLRKMLDLFDGDVHRALAAYNAGPGTVARYDGKVPYAETRAYVQCVLRYADYYSDADVT